MQNQAYFVYKLTNDNNSKVYIGVSQNPENRLKQHRYQARSSATQTPLYRAMRKYGVDAFEMTILYGSRDHNHVFNEMEGYFIREYNSIHPSFGYNLTTGGEGSPENRKVAQLRKEKLKISETRKRSWASKTPEEMEDFRTKMKGVGANISEDTRKKRSAAAKAQHSDLNKSRKHKQAAAKANQDPEKRRRIAEAAKARWADPEFRAKMSVKYSTQEKIEKKKKAALARWSA